MVFNAIFNNISVISWRSVHWWRKPDYTEKTTVGGGGLCNRIGGVMVSVLASTVVDRGFEPRSGQTKDYEIGICCFSAKHACWRKNKD